MANMQETYDGQYNQDPNQLTNRMSIERRKYPVEKFGIKNEWKAVDTHLAEVNEQINKADRDIKSLRRGELQRSYDSKLVEGELVRNAAMEQKQREYEDMKMRERIAEMESLNMKKNNLALQNHLAFRYSNMMDERAKKMEEERQKSLFDGMDMAQRAKLSLDMEKEHIKLKNDRYKMEAQAVVDEKEARKQMEKMKYVQDKQVYTDQVKNNAQMEILREANYRNFFKQVNDSQSVLQHLHQEKVLSPELQKKQALDEIVRRNEEEYRRRKEEEEKYRLQKRKEDYHSMAEKLKEQMAVHEYHRKAGVQEHDRDHQQSLAKSMEYQDLMNAMKAERTSQKNWYKNILDRQTMEKHGQYDKYHSMTRMEKGINHEPLQAYKGHDTHIAALVPGYTNSKYIHPYSPEARYAQVIQHKNFFGGAPSPSQKTLPTSGMNGMHGLNSSNDQPRLNTVLSNNHSAVDINLQKDSIPPPLAVAGAALGKSDGQIGANLAPSPAHSEPQKFITSPSPMLPTSPNGLGKFQVTRHNPILNPVPNNNQNPYIQRELRRLATFANQGNGGAPGQMNYLASVANNNIFSN